MGRWGCEIEIILEVIDSIEEMPKDLEVFRNWNVHKLSGDLKDFWSVKVNKNYRIIFRFDSNGVHDVDYIDYH